MLFSALLISGLLCGLIPTGGSSTRVTQFIKRLNDEPTFEANLVPVDRETNLLIQGALNDSCIPTVFWHGMGDTALGSVGVIARALREKFPRLVLFSVRIGDNAYEDEMSGYLGNVNQQVEQVCNAILANELIRKQGFLNMLGFSQGAQFLRAVVQRCPLREHNIHVRNYVSLGGQHEGVFGLPRCKSNPICEHINYLITHAAYEQTVQEHIVQAQYWHDPTKESLYRNKSNFLADINNENTLNSIYRYNLEHLGNMVLVQFLNDSMVTPPESSSFGFFATDNTHKVNTWTANPALYKEDRLGLRSLMDTYRLKIIKIPGNHLQFTIDWFMEGLAKYFKP